MSKKRHAPHYGPNPLQVALQHHEAGRLDQAEALYRKMPNNPDAVNLQGVIAFQTGNYSKAVELIGKALRLTPSNAVFHYNQALAYRAQDKQEEAVAAYRKAVSFNPSHFDALNNLGVLLHEMGRLDEAIACYLELLKTNPAFIQAYCNLGAALRGQGKLAEAAAVCREGLKLQPDDPATMSNLGVVLKEQGQLDEAIECFRRALARNPDFLDALNNLGSALEARGDTEEAVAAYRRAVALNPGHAVALSNLGSPLLFLGRLDEAAACFRQAIELSPDLAEAHNNLGNVFLRQGKLDEAIEYFGTAVRIHPEFATAYSNFLFAHNYHPALSAEQIYAAYRQWNDDLMARIPANAKPFANPRDPERRLKIGYVSPDFNNHSVMRFAGPLLELRDKTRFEVICYYNRAYFDPETVRIVQTVDRFEACASLSDDDLAQRIRADGIDILVDLAGHTGCNRLTLFARKPAPVQVSWLGFGYTTGLTAIDYFIGDPVFTPPGCEHLFSETVYRLPHAAWTYQPPPEAPESGPLPARGRGHVTFAFTGRSERINDPMIAAWAALLLRVPGSRLRIDSRNFSDAGLRQDMEQRFAAHGVPPDRLELGYTSPVWDVYRNVDIVLDCFPHNSGTTTFEALWMGLPVVTLAGRPSVGRLGASILACIGRPQWIATDAGDYVERAAALAQDIDALERERAGLRAAMQASPLLDRPGFVRDMEAAFRDMWARWCAGRQVDPQPATAAGQAAAILDAALDHHRAGRLDEAAALYRQALSLDTKLFAAHNNLGNILDDRGETAQAIACYERALAIHPDAAPTLESLGAALFKTGRQEEAAAPLRRALEIDPGRVSTHNNLGAILLRLGQLEQAKACLQRALTLKADNADACNNLGIALLSQGKIDEAIGRFQEALRIAPQLSSARTSLLFAYNYHPAMTAEAIFSIYREWGKDLEAQYEAERPAFANVPDAGRRLRIGYVSPDFNNHSVMRFAGPLLELRDKTRFEVICYYNRTVRDADTERVAASVDRLLPCHGMTDDELAQRIRADGIDILVDLAGHTEGNRLPVFARKPAPVQVSWLGFGYTTGLTAIDYFIGDPVFTPPGCEHLFSETVWRLPRTTWTYQPPPEAPEPGPLPARGRGHVTFAFTGRSERINDPMIAAWARLLLCVPGSRLRIDSRNFSDAILRQDMEQRFAAHGVPPDRLELGFTSPVWDVYRNVDIVLDCFPHNSGTTTFEALWMGLPVVTLAGRPSVGRLGASILACIGRPQWIATDADDYVERAAALAQDIDALERERAALRAAMQASPLLDRPGFVRDMEAAFRDMWTRWCAGRQVDPQPATAAGQAAAILDAALDHHRAGRLDEAAALYRTLSAQPDAIHLLGVVALQQGRPAEAAEQIARAIALNPGNPEYHCNLGTARLGLRQFEQAADSLARAVAMHPDYPLARNNLGNALRELGRLDEAVDSFRCALALQPNYAEAHLNLGSSLRKMGRLDEAIASYRQALAIQPGLADAHYNLGNALLAQGQLDQACAAFQTAIALRPQLKEAHYNLGDILLRQRKFEEAGACFRHAIDIDPGFGDAHNHLGNVLLHQDKLAEARICFEQALHINPRSADAFNNLGNVFLRQGRVDEAITQYRKSLAERPESAATFSNVLFAGHFSSTMPDEELHAEHLRFAELYEAPLKQQWLPHANTRDPQRRLKVGYLSPDLMWHAVAYFTEPVLAAHDKTNFEVYCYHSGRQQDSYTDRLMAYADHWVRCAHMSDEELAARIRADGIDILIELSGHTSNNRLLTCSRKPAPLQITYLGYPDTTGLTAIDYRLTDRHADPEGSERYYVEQLLYMPDSFTCYGALDEFPEVGPLPALNNGYITFGSFNAASKIDRKTVALWARLLKALPSARLVLATIPEGERQERIAQQFQEDGIPAQRLEFLPHLKTKEFRELFQRVDIGLDPLLVTGGTTTCETLWMGVPVVALAGKRFVNRVTHSYLHSAGLGHFSGQTPDDYVRIAVEESAQLENLARLRAEMRGRLAVSPLMDRVKFTRHLERAYRTIWTKWCEG